MENTNRNEKLIKLGNVEILLRPTFENLCAMESKLGALSFITWKISRSVKVRKNEKTGAEEAVVSRADMLPLTFIAQVIYLCQAAVNPQDPTQKKFSQEDVWDMVQGEGVGCLIPVTQFLMRVGNGNKLQAEVSEDEKKS